MRKNVPKFSKSVARRDNKMAQGDYAFLDIPVDRSATLLGLTVEGGADTPQKGSRRWLL